MATSCQFRTRTSEVGDHTMGRKRTSLRRRATRRSNTRRALGTCNLGFEVLEDRRMLTVINWTNRNIFEHSPPPAVDNDNRFDSAFDIVRNGVLDTSRRDAAIAVVDAAIADWERVITSFADPSMVYNIKISMDSDGTTGTGIARWWTRIRFWM